MRPYFMRQSKFDHVTSLSQDEFSLTEEKVGKLGEF